MLSDTTHTRQNEEQKAEGQYHLPTFSCKLMPAACWPIQQSAVYVRKKKHTAVAKLRYGMIKRKFNRAAVRKIWTKISRTSINVFLQKLLVAVCYQVAWIFKHVQIGSKWPFKFDITTRYDTPPKQVEVVPISAHFCLKSEFIRKLKMRLQK